MAKAKKLPSGNWRVNLYIGKDEVTQKRKYKSFTAETKKEAEFMAAEYSLNKKEAPKKMTVGDAIDKYIESKENVLSPTTIAGYKKIRRNNLQGLMSKPLDKITQIDVQLEINRESKNKSAKTISNAHGLLSAALNMYYPDMVLKTTLPRKDKKIKELIAPEKIFAAVHGTEIELPVLLGMWLGLRMSEIRGIKRSAVSDDGYLTVNNVVVTADGKNIEKTSTKTVSSTRKLKLPYQILSLIPADISEDEYIIKLSGQAIYKRFSRLLEKNNLPHMTFHDLRHINASVMLKLGIPDKYAMERGGWSTNSTLKAVYQHTFSEERELIDSKIDDFFENVCNTKCNTKNK